MTRTHRGTPEHREKMHWANGKLPTYSRLPYDISCTWTQFQATPYGKTEKVLSDILSGKTWLVMDLDKSRSETLEEDAEKELHDMSRISGDYWDTEEVQIPEQQPGEQGRSLDTPPIPDKG